jgi:toxin ParE1/3/4
LAAYEISYLPLALADLEETFHYIVDKLEAPQAAQKLRNEIDITVRRLRRFPYAHTLYRSQKTLKKEYRKLIVKNYYLFYVVEEKTVEILRVIYAKRNIESIL